MDASGLRVWLELCDASSECLAQPPRQAVRVMVKMTLSAEGRAMNFEEHAAKPLLRAAGIATPTGAACSQRRRGWRPLQPRLGPCVVKAQVPTGKRGKAGGIKLATSRSEAKAAAAAILGMSIGEHRVEKVLVEAQVPIAREMYAAVLERSRVQGPAAAVLRAGGMDIEEIAAKHPDALVRLPIDIRTGLDRQGVCERALPADLPCDRDALVVPCSRLYAVYAGQRRRAYGDQSAGRDQGRRLVALDCKLTMDDSAIPRMRSLAGSGHAGTI